MPYKYLCRAEIFFRPGGANDPADAKTKVDALVHPVAANVLGHDFVATATDRENLVDVVLQKFNDLQQLLGYPHAATKSGKKDWAYGSGGLHEDVRRLDQGGPEWSVEGDQHAMVAYLRLVSEQLA